MVEAIWKNAETNWNVAKLFELMAEWPGHTARGQVGSIQYYCLGLSRLCRLGQCMALLCRHLSNELAHLDHARPAVNIRETVLNELPGCEHLGSGSHILPNLCHNNSWPLFLWIAVVKWPRIGAMGGWGQLVWSLLDPGSMGVRGDGTSTWLDCLPQGCYFGKTMSEPVCIHFYEIVVNIHWYYVLHKYGLYWRFNMTQMASHTFNCLFSIHLLTYLPAC